MSALLKGIAMAAPTIIKGLGAGRRLFGNVPQMKTSNDTTRYLNRLRQVSKEGLYGQDVKNEIGADIQQSSQNTRSAIRGSAVRQGLENSGVVAQQLLKEGGQTTLQIARTARKIAEMNKESQLRASANAAAIGQGIEDRRYQNALSRMQRRDEGLSMLSGLFDKGDEDDEIMDFIDDLQGLGLENLG